MNLQQAVSIGFSSGDSKCFMFEIAHAYGKTRYFNLSPVHTMMMKTFHCRCVVGGSQGDARVLLDLIFCNEKIS